MATTDYPTYDGKGDDDDTLYCEACGRPVGEDDDLDDWQVSDVGVVVCPHCAMLAEADGLEQADRQGL